MKIGVFEWVSGGGLSADNQSETSASLLIEGWAMLSLLIEQIAASGNEVVASIDSMLASKSDFIDWWSKMSLAAKPSGKIHLHQMPVLPGRAAVLDYWIKIARQCDECLIIAPEIDGILEQSIDRISRQQIPLLNCSGAFLQNCCDKWKTAQLLIAAGLPHPATWSACEVDEIPTHLSKSWCCKSRWGAGCEAMVVADAQALADHCQHLKNPAQWIIQPWMAGESFSCSAIINRAGVVYWMPMTTQHIVIEQSRAGASPVRYLGGTVLPKMLQKQRPLEILEKTRQLLAEGEPDGSLGWVGFDFVRTPLGEWYIIEVNPRITSSIIGLSKAAPGNLSELLIQPDSDPSGRLMSGEWSETEFRLK